MRMKYTTWHEFSCRQYSDIEDTVHHTWSIGFDLLNVTAGGRPFATSPSDNEIIDLPHDLISVRKDLLDIHILMYMQPTSHFIVQTL